MPLKPSSDYKEFEPGTYEVNLIEFFTTDDDGNPIFVAQEWGDEVRMVARYRTYKDTVSDETEGPPGSISPNEVKLFVHAFGGDVSRVPDDNLKALSVAEEEVRNADKTTRVSVGEKGWIVNVYDMNLPTGEYVAKFNGFRNRNEVGEPTWFSGRYGEHSVARLEVCMPDNPFDGTELELWFSKDWFYVPRAFIPDFYEGSLEQDGSETPVLTAFEELAKESSESGNRVAFRVEPNEEGSRPRIQRDTVRPVAVDEAVDITGKDEEGYRSHLYQAIADATDEKPWRKSGAFVSPGKLSDAGVTWAKEHLAPICREHKIPKRFEDMDEQNVKTILEELGRDDLAGMVQGEEDDPW